MATVQEIMLDSIVKAYRSAEQITINTDRAKAFTDLATACAAALGTAKPAAEDTAVTTVPAAATPAAKTVKRSSKKAAEPSAEEQKTVEQPPAAAAEPEKSAAKEEEKVEEPAAEAKPDIKAEEKAKEEDKTKEKEKDSDDTKTEEDFSEEWTLNALDYFKEEINEMERYQDMFSDDVNSLNKMIQEATEGHCNDVDDITPLNIRLILAFIKNLEEQGQ